MADTKGTVWDHIQGKLSLGYVDIGEQTVKNIPRPVRAYRLRIDGSIEEVAAAPPASSARWRTGIVAGIAAGIAAVMLAAGFAAWQFWPQPQQPIAQSARASAPPAVAQTDAAVGERRPPAPSE